MATNPRTHLPSTDLKVDKELQSVDGAPVADLVRYWGVPDTPSTRPNQPPTSTDPATTRPASRPERTPSTPPTPHHNPPLTSANVLNVRSHLNVGRPPAPETARLGRRALRLRSCAEVPAGAADLGAAAGAARGGARPRRGRQGRLPAPRHRLRGDVRSWCDDQSLPWCERALGQPVVVPSAEVRLSKHALMPQVGLSRP